MDIFYLKIALSPVICAFIGWLTNYLAVKMLFHPRKPVKLPFFTVQGIFPKRQEALAKNLGDVVQGELISHEDVTRLLEDETFLTRVKEMADSYVDELLREKLTAVNPMIAMFLNSESAGKIKSVLSNEISALIPKVVAETSAQLEQHLDIHDMVRKKVEAFSMDKLEDILFAIMKREFRFIEIVGGVLGFLVGLFQAAVFAL